MVRTQIQFTEDQAEALKRVAAARDVSVAQVVRDAVDKELAAKSEGILRALELTAGKYRSGRSDISRDHDRYIAEAFHDWESS